MGGIYSCTDPTTVRIDAPLLVFVLSMLRALAMHVRHRCALSNQEVMFGITAIIRKVAYSLLSHRCVPEAESCLDPRLI